MRGGAAGRCVPRNNHKRKTNAYVRYCRIRRTERGHRLLDYWSAPPGISRLRQFGRRVADSRTASDRRQVGRTHRSPGSTAQRGAHDRPHRHRPHPLGHPRRAERHQRPSPPRRRRRSGRRPQRRHREFPVAQTAPHRGGLHLPVGHRYRSDRPSRGELPEAPARQWTTWRPPDYQPLVDRRAARRSRNSRAPTAWRSSSATGRTC